MYLGWELVTLARFDMDKTCAVIEKYRVTYAYVPPPIVLAFSKHPAVDKYDVTSLRMLHSGAAPLTRELTEALWDRLKLPVKQGFGLSETSPVSHLQTPDEWGKFMGSVGKLMPNMEAKIIDPDGNEVAEGQVCVCVCVCVPCAVCRLPPTTALERESVCVRVGPLLTRTTAPTGRRAVA